MDENDDESLGWDELFSGSFVSDEYGRLLLTENDELEVVYTGMDEEGTYETDYKFSSFICNYLVELKLS